MTTQSREREGKRRKPKFKVGQVVAWCSSDGEPLLYLQIKAFCWDRENELRYTFDVHQESWADYLCPNEKLLRPLTARERGHD